MISKYKSLIYGFMFRQLKCGSSQVLSPVRNSQGYAVVGGSHVKNVKNTYNMPIDKISWKLRNYVKMKLILTHRWSVIAIGTHWKGTISFERIKFLISELNRKYKKLSWVVHPKELGRKRKSAHTERQHTHMEKESAQVGRKPHISKKAV